MKYTFDNTHIITGYIKELLRDFNLPTCKVYNDSLPIEDGRTYIKGNYFYLGKYDRPRDLYYLEKQSSFELGNSYDNLTKTLDIKSNYYDTYTHEYLGEYLRFLKNYKGIDLMPLYNCYSNYWIESVNKYIVSSMFRSIHNLTSNGEFVYYIFPVKFFEKYTISLNSQASAEVFLVFKEELTENKSLYEETNKKYNQITKKKPVVFDTSISSEFKKSYSQYWAHEENLRMVIKLPTYVKTSIAVLEGDYRVNTNYSGDYFSPRLYGDLSGENLKLLKNMTKLSLLDNMSNASFPFADRLVEYLVGLAITPLEDIPGNVGRIKQKVYNRNDLTKKLFKGYFDDFDDNLFNNLYEILNQSKIILGTGLNLKIDRGADVFMDGNKLEDRNTSLVDRIPDLLYYIDKDVESLVNSL